MEEVAWLALALSAVTFVWQVVEAHTRRRTKVVIQVHHLAVPASIADGPALLLVPAIGLDPRRVIWPSPDEALTYVLAIAVVNLGEMNESVADVHVGELEGTAGAGASDGTGSRELPPRDRVVWAFRVDGVRFDIEAGFIVRAVLGSGKCLQSGPHSLDLELEEVIAQHNAELPASADSGSAG